MDDTTVPSGPPTSVPSAIDLNPYTAPTQSSPFGGMGIFGPPSDPNAEGLFASRGTGFGLMSLGANMITAANQRTSGGFLANPSFLGSLGAGLAATMRQGQEDAKNRATMGEQAARTIGQQLSNQKAAAELPLIQLTQAQQLYFMQHPEEFAPYLMRLYGPMLNGPGTGGGGATGGGSRHANVAPATYEGSGTALAKSDLAPTISRVAMANGIPLALAYAVLQQESSLGTNPHAGGNVGQVIPTTAANPGYGMSPLSQEDMNNPEKNIAFSLQYLRKVGDAQGVDWANSQTWGKALRGYNGEGDPAYVEHVARYLPKGTKIYDPGLGQGPGPAPVAGQPPPTVPAGGPRVPANSPAATGTSSAAAAPPNPYQVASAGASVPGSSAGGSYVPGAQAPDAGQVSSDVQAMLAGRAQAQQAAGRGGVQVAQASGPPPVSGAPTSLPSPFVGMATAALGGQPPPATPASAPAPASTTPATAAPGATQPPPGPAPVQRAASAVPQQAPDYAAIHAQRAQDYLQQANRVELLQAAAKRFNMPPPPGDPVLLRQLAAQENEAALRAGSAGPTKQAESGANVPSGYEQTPGGLRPQTGGPADPAVIAANKYVETAAQAGAQNVEVRPDGLARVTQSDGKQIWVRGAHYLEKEQPDGSKIGGYLLPPLPGQKEGDPGIFVPAKDNAGNFLITRNPEWITSMRKEAADTYQKEGTETYIAAQNGQGLLTQLTHSADILTEHGGFLSLGPTANERIGFLAGLNDVLRSAGIAPIAASSVGAWEEINKATQQLGFETASHYEGHSRQAAQTILNATKINPGAINSEAGFRRVAAGVMEAQQSAIDYHDYQTNLIKQGKSLETAADDFYKSNSPRMYGLRALSTIEPIVIKNKSEYAKYLPGTFIKWKDANGQDQIGQVPERQGSPSIPEWLKAPPQFAGPGSVKPGATQ